MQKHDHSAFQDLGIKGQLHPDDKKIKYHFAFDTDYDDRHKARLVARGLLVGMPLPSVQSGVVPLIGIWLILFLVDLSGLWSWDTDIGNTRLEANTKEKAHVIAGP